MSEPTPLTIDLRAPRDSAEEAVAGLVVVPAVADELGQRFADAGHELHLVGGSVRDLLLSRAAHETPDLDFATDATPEQVARLTKGWHGGLWESGVAFGTLGLMKDGARLEITTYRSESYDPGSRNPEVSYGDTLAGDLSRRDFTVNAMAVSVPGHVFTDLFGGLRDLAAGMLRTPGTPEDSFSDDPLRMMRAARFAAQLGFTPVADVVIAMSAMAERLQIVSAERVRDELTKLLVSPDPVVGLELLVGTGLAEVVLPELPRMQIAVDPLHRHKDVYAHSLAVLQRAVSMEPGGPDLVLRMAALLHDIGKPDTKRHEAGGGVSFHHHELVGARMARTRLRELRYDKAFITEVVRLIELHLRFHGYGKGEWTDSAVRRYVTDAGPVLERLHLLVRSDCTTRNRRKAEMLDAAYDDLEERIARLAEEEDLRAVRPDLDGNEIMALLGVGPGKVVGEAWSMLKELRLDRGPLPRDQAVEALLAWAVERGITPPDPA